jgi:hypothetical protein
MVGMSRYDGLNPAAPQNAAGADRGAAGLRAAAIRLARSRAESIAPGLTHHAGLSISVTSACVMRRANGMAK